MGERSKTKTAAAIAALSSGAGALAAQAASMPSTFHYETITKVVPLMGASYPFSTTNASKVIATVAGQKIVELGGFYSPGLKDSGMLLLSLFGQDLGKDGGTALLSIGSNWISIGMGINIPVSVLPNGTEVALKSVDGANSAATLAFTAPIHGLTPETAAIAALAAVAIGGSAAYLAIKGRHGLKETVRDSLPIAAISGGLGALAEEYITWPSTLHYETITKTVSLYPYPSNYVIATIGGQKILEIGSLISPQPYPNGGAILLANAATASPDPLNGTLLILSNGYNPVGKFLGLSGLGGNIGSGILPGNVQATLNGIDAARQTASVTLTAATTGFTPETAALTALAIAAIGGGLYALARRYNENLDKRVKEEAMNAVAGIRGGIARIFSGLQRKTLESE